MKTPLFTSCVLASIFCNSPAWGHDSSWYIEERGGISQASSYRFALPQVNGNGPPIELFHLGSGTGDYVASSVGYDFGKVRLEVQFETSGANLNSFTDATTGQSNLSQNGQLSGHLGRTTVMSNAMVDLGSNHSLQFYAGAGFGLTRTKVSFFSLETMNNQAITTSIQNSSTGIAWQGFAGMRYPISRKIDLGLMFRYKQERKLTFQLCESCTSSNDTTGLEASGASQAVALSLGYRFGGR